eukprot:maker-scaffold280_size224562-snap-gene-0.14 protein:Tk08826 transcript:maker-scaffold280_size224562-snap-gene-0.14-mRNA-1 annotation:"cbn-nas-6 protein"
MDQGRYRLACAAMIGLNFLVQTASGRYQYLTEDNFLRGRNIDVKSLVSAIPEFKEWVEPKITFTGGAEDKSVWSIWPNGAIPYTIQGNFSPSDLDAIAASIEHIEANSCVRFFPTQKPDSLPRMDIFDSYEEFGVCYTAWQTDGGSGTYAEVNLSPNSACTVPRTIIHEMMHGMAMYHTHKRADRDDFVNVLWNNVLPSKVDEFSTCSGCCCDTWDEPYDCGSIMHYAKNQMSVNGLDTLASVNDGCQLMTFSEWNYHEPWMSASDWDLVNRQYC